ncbi:WD40-repeat-containing domain protein [Aspergillus filifer]
MEAAGLMNSFQHLSPEVFATITTLTNRNSGRVVPVQAARASRSRREFTDNDNACLRDLLVADPETERQRIEATKGGLLDDSFRWVLGNPEFQKWHSSHQSHLLWIKGDPGKGKTMLMIGIINELLQQNQSQQSQFIAYFLCQATDPRLRNATSILRGLIYMLVQQQPHLISHLREKYDTNPKLFEGGNPFYSLSVIFENMIQDSTDARTYLIVDALDECETDLSDLLKLIARTKFMPAARVKWIVSSRNREDIEQELEIVASASVDRTIRLWDTATGAEKQTLKGHKSSVTTVAFSPDGQIVASASRDQTIRLWDTATGTEKQTLKGHKGWVNIVAFSPDGQTVASASRDQTIRLWNTATGAKKQTLEGHKSLVTAVAFLSDGQIVASASWDQTIWLWDTATGAKKQTLEGHEGSVTAVAFSPNGQIVASASRDRTIRLWDTATGAEKQTLKGHKGLVNAVAFSPNGQTVASASWDRTIRLWDMATGAKKQTLRGHEDWVNAVAFSPNGQTVASASKDQTIRLWDTATGAEKQIYKSNVIVTAIWFSANGFCLNSDRGLISLNLDASYTSNNSIFVHEKWIFQNGRRLMWLPPQYRATCVLATESTVILGHQSGALTFLRLA